MTLKHSPRTATPEQLNWLSIPGVQARYNLRATGKPNLGWHAYCLSFIPRERLRRSRMLILGCGSGWLERDLFRRTAFTECDVIDPSAEAVEAARSAAEAEGCHGISYRVADLDQIDLPTERYDAIWSDNFLCYSDDIERLSAQIASALSTGGMLFANGYTGPNDYAFLPRQREAIQSAFSLIPQRYCKRLDVPGQEAHEVGSFSARAEPTPTASAELIRVLERRFALLQRRALGGTVLQSVLNGIAPNFRPEDRIANLVLEMLFRIEDALIDSGELASDFSLLVARPNGAAG